MSRHAMTWVVFWTIVGCLALVLWQVLGERDPSPEGTPSSATGLDRGGQFPASARRSPPARTGDADSKRGLLRSLPQPASPPAGSDAEVKSAWLEKRLKAIEDASYEEDEDSLRLLIVEYGSPEAVISQAAYECLMARQDKRAIPYLKEMLALNHATRRQLDIEELIEFINTPSIFEFKRSEER